MKKFKDLTGQKFGKLTALYRLHNYHKKDTYWLCVCDCGDFMKCTVSNLKRVKSCFKCRKPSNIRHNNVHTRLYRIHQGIIINRKKHIKIMEGVVLPCAKNGVKIL